MRASRLRSLVAGSYAAIAVAALCRPAAVPAVFGGCAPTAAARTEVRSVYAGIPLAFAASLIVAERSTSGGRSGTVATIRDASAGMALARLVGAAVERQLRPWPTAAFIAFEAGLALALEVAQRSDGAS